MTIRPNNNPATADSANRLVRSAERWAAGAGLCFVALLVLGLLTSPAGASSSSPATTIALYYAQQHAADLRADYLSLIAFPVLAGFIVGMARRLAPAGSPVASLLVGLGLMGIGFELAATAIEISLASAIHRMAPAPVVAAFFQVASRLFFVATLLVGLAVLCAAIAGLRGRGVPQWLSALGLLAGVCLTVSGLSAASPHGPLAAALLPGEGLFLAYVVSASVVLLRSPGDLEPSGQLPARKYFDRSSARG